MNEKDIFDAIANIDDELIESGASKRAVKKTPLKIALIAVAVVLVAAVAIGVIIATRGPGIPGPKGYVEYENYSTFLFDTGGMFSNAIPDTEVLIVDDRYGNGTDPAMPDPSQYKYVFGQLSEEGLGYVGYWWSESVMQAIQFNSDGTMFYFMLESKDVYRVVCKGYFNVVGGEMTLYSAEAGSGGTVLVENFGDYITAQPEGEVAMPFLKAENHLKAATYKGEDKSWNGAMDFRNIPWKLDDENLEIVFGGSHRMAFTYGDGSRRDQDYVWNQADNTVVFDDWNDPKSRSWTGRIEDDFLVISSGATVFELYDPAKTGKTFPFDTFLGFAPSPDNDRYIMFRSDGTYLIVRVNYYMNDPYDENTRLAWLAGNYELEDEDLSMPRSLVVFRPSDLPPTEEAKALLSGGDKLVDMFTDKKTQSEIKLKVELADEILYFTRPDSGERIELRQYLP